MKKLIAFLLIVAVFTVALASCAKKAPDVPATPTPTEATPEVTTTVTPEPTPTPTPEPTPTPALDFVPEITDLIYSDSIDVGQGRVFIVTCFFPQTGVSAIDSFYMEQHDGYIEYAGEWAAEFRLYEDEPDWLTEYEMSYDYEIVKNSGNILSVHSMNYIYTGGAHGYTGDICDSFRISDG